jgi:hypothetical protein
MRTDNFKMILDILTAIESQMDNDQVDWSLFSADALAVSSPRWLKIMTMMNDEGLIKGFGYQRKSGQIMLDVGGVRLTLAGLWYIREVTR